ncbi:HEAT repeat domain-containing protein [Nocardioidaceae bacterium]|nr:HEAT repeat domain-containing protein [Nocardioidaceae bacterium]
MTSGSLTSPFLLAVPTALAACSAVALVATLVVMRLRAPRQSAARAARQAAVRDLLFAALMGEPDEAVAARADLGRRHGAAWSVAEQQAFGMLPKIKGHSRTALVQVLDDKGAAERAVAKTAAWSWVRRCQGAYELGALGARTGVPILLPMLDDSNFVVRRVAVRALGAIGEPASVTPLLQVAGEEPRLTNDLVFALDHLALDAAPALRTELHRALEQRGGGGRQAALAATGLGLIGDVGSAALLVRALASGRPEVQVAAAEALGRLGVPDALPALVSALEVDDEAVRLAAVTALGELAADQAASALSRWLDSDHHEIGRQAAASLVRLPSGPQVLAASASPFAREALAMAPSPVPGP